MAVWLLEIRSYAIKVPTIGPIYTSFSLSFKQLKILFPFFLLFTILSIFPDVTRNAGLVAEAYPVCGFESRVDTRCTGFHCGPFPRGIERFQIISCEISELAD